MAAQCSQAGSFKEPNRALAWFQAFTTGIMASSYYRPYIEGLGLAGNERVLEYGSGSGAASRYLAEALQNGGRLTCLDISRVWIRYAKRATRKYSNVDFMQGDIEDMGIPGESCDIVFIHFMLHDIPAGIRKEKSKVLLSKLKKGGKAFVREPTGDHHGMSALEIRAIMAANGLREVSSGTGKSPQRWPTFQGVYVK